MGGSARNGDYVHGIGISPTNPKKMKFGELEKQLNNAFKVGSTLQKAKAVGNIFEMHGAVTFTNVYSNLSKSLKGQLRKLVKEYYVSLTCSAFRFAAESMLGIRF